MTNCKFCDDRACNGCPTQEKGWKILDPDEKVLQGDQYTSGDTVGGIVRWKESNNWKGPLYGIQADTKTYRRKISQ